MSLNEKINGLRSLLSEYDESETYLDRLVLVDKVFGHVLPSLVDALEVVDYSLDDLSIRSKIDEALEGVLM